jgi:hypothetical protein
METVTFVTVSSGLLDITALISSKPQAITADTSLGAFTDTLLDGRRHAHNVRLQARGAAAEWDGIVLPDDMPLAPTTPATTQNLGRPSHLYVDQAPDRSR